jgi:hypothetical protein
MTREEAIFYIKELQKTYASMDRKVAEAIDMAIEALSAESEQIVYCMDCEKSAPLDEHGALWYCKAHDRTMLRHSYCNNGERKGGDTE